MGQKSQVQDHTPQKVGPFTFFLGGNIRDWMLWGLPCFRKPTLTVPQTSQPSPKPWHLCPLISAPKTTTLDQAKITCLLAHTWWILANPPTRGLVTAAGAAGQSD